MNDAAQCWAETLGEIELQMTPATFNTWLRGTEVVGREPDRRGANGTVVVRVRHEYGVDWLQNRLLPSIRPTVERHFGEGVEVLFVGPGGQAPPVPCRDGVRKGDPAPEEPEAEVDEAGSSQVEIELVTDPALAAFDVATTGWSKLANYAIDFWAELLGPAAFLTWMAVKSEDIRRDKGVWTPPMRFSVSRLARIAAAANNQQVTGVWRTCRSAAIVERGEPCEHCKSRGGIIEAGVCRYWRPGAFDVLQAEGVAIVARSGEGLATSYRVRVFNNLPLLTPAQVARLHPVTQETHDRWLRKQNLDAEAWERLTVASLALPDFADVNNKH